MTDKDWHGVLRLVVTILVVALANIPAALALELSVRAVAVPALASRRADAKTLTAKELLQRQIGQYWLGEHGLQ